MKLFSAFEDFKNETLAGIPSKFGRLRFLAEMRKDGKYQHWGMSKMHGDEAAQNAIAEAHSETFEQSLTIPIPALLAEDSAGDAARLSADIPPAVPCELRGGTVRHFRWILRVAELLKRFPRPSNPGA